MPSHWALVVPMANEEAEFFPFIDALKKAIEELSPGKIFLVVDNASKDRTRALCDELCRNDGRFVSVWAPENKNVVDAYIRGYNEALHTDAEYIIEMDAGLSHDPMALKDFLKLLSGKFSCVYGSRFIKGGSMGDSPANRRSLSKTGTILANFLLGTKLHDMTSGYQGFHRDIVKLFAGYKFLSTGHFYQTEIRYLLRKHNGIEMPIHYRAPSPRISPGSIANSIGTLFYYFWRRITFRPVSL